MNVPHPALAPRPASRGVLGEVQGACLDVNVSRSLTPPPKQTLVPVTTTEPRAGPAATKRTRFWHSYTIFCPLVGQKTVIVDVPYPALSAVSPLRVRSAGQNDDEDVWAGRRCCSWPGSVPGMIGPVTSEVAWGGQRLPGLPLPLPGPQKKSQRRRWPRWRALWAPFLATSTADFGGSPGAFPGDPPKSRMDRSRQAECCGVSTEILTA